MEITKANIKELVGRELIHKDGDVGMKILFIENENINFKFSDSHNISFRDIDTVLEYINKGLWILLPQQDTTQAHYDNTNGSLYLFAEQHGLNAWEFEIIKRIVRCRKKGEFISDIEKTIEVLNLYLKEQGHKYEGQIEKLNK